MRDLQELKKMGEISEDDERRAEAELQDLTGSYVNRIDAALSDKEAELLEV
jgi:ribosome recycling factor